MSSLSTYYPGLEPSFLQAAEAVARRQGIRPGWLMAVMDFETGGTFDPAATNPYSGFVGLLQFGPDAAADLSTTTDALRSMTRTEQLQYVEEYLAMRQRQFGPLRSLEDTYMSVLYPEAIGAKDSYVLFRSPSTAYRQNSALDKSGDGTITKAEATAPVRRRLRTGGGLPLLAGGPAGDLLGIVILSSGLAAVASLVLSPKKRS